MDSSKIQARVDIKYFSLTPYVYILGVTCSGVHASDAELFNGLKPVCSALLKYSFPEGGLDNTEGT
jgi:hypothetical protein